MEDIAEVEEQLSTGCFQLFTYLQTCDLISSRHRFGCQRHFKGCTSFTSSTRIIERNSIRRFYSELRSSVRTDCAKSHPKSGVIALKLVGKSTLTRSPEMSSNFNHNEFAAGDYTYGENGYWNDSNFNAFDSEFPSHDDIGQADGGGQAWNYAPDSFDLAGRSEHQTQPFTWGNNIASNNYLPAGDAVNHFNSTFISVTPNVDTQYHQNTFTSVQDDFTSHSRPPSRQGVTTGPAFPASPYTFENDATVPRPVQPGAIAPQALQLSESAKGSMSREVG